MLKYGNISAKLLKSIQKSANFKKIWLIGNLRSF